MITQKDIEYVDLTSKDLDECIANAQHLYKHVIDRPDLHGRDEYERFNNVLMGEVAEMMVYRWLQKNKKFVERTVDKTADKPDLGHDLRIRKNNGEDILCSVKSSLSALKKPEEIIKNFTIATKRSELRDANIQVYFWLDLNPPYNAPRTVVPSFNKSAIIGWVGRKDIEKFTTYNHQQRENPSQKLSESRPMEELLRFIE